MEARRTVCGALAAACALVCALGCALPARALASSTEKSILIDDDQLIYTTPAQVAQTLERAAALGIEQVKVSMVWSLVAPDAASSQEPDFDASDPAAYPPGAWDRYDTVVRLATALGISVYFQFTAPAPTWAVAANPKPQPYRWYPYVQSPNTAEFGQFVTAVATRYSGSYNAAPPADVPSPSVLKLPVGLGLGGISIRLPNGLTTQQAAQAATSDVIPRVSTWGIWNEPNEGTWLNPQYKTVHHKIVLVSPRLYRGLVDAGYGALTATGHSGDTILIGETASGGVIRPLQFVEALYCVGSSDEPLSGDAATAIGCPASGSPAAFAGEHPGLFDGVGYADHPYSFDVPPSTPYRLSQYVTIANLPQFERVLNQIFTVYGKLPRGGVPQYITEWGYKSNPPNPYVRTSLSQQATWLNQGQYMSYKLPYVHSNAQFLLVDDAPRAGKRPGSRSYWSTFQTGLFYQNGKPKPSYDAYRIPIWLPHPRAGSRVTVWGQLRPANHTSAQFAIIEYERKGTSSWRQIREVQTDNSQGYLVAHVRLPAAGQVRLEWLNPGSGALEFSRNATVR
jgi:hypothetical protein